MSHPVNDEILEELVSGLQIIVSGYHNLRQYIMADRERLELLAPEDIRFLNQISKAIKEYNPYGATRDKTHEDNAVKVRIERPQDEPRQ